MADTLDLFVALQTSKAIDSFNGMMSHFGNGGNQLSKIGGTMTAGVTAPIVAGLGVATSEAVKFNSAISNSTRTLDLTKEETAALSKEVLTLAPSLGLLPTEFANVAAEAGKLGVAKKEVAEFGKTIANLSTITDVPIAEFTKKAGTIKTIFGQNTTEFEKFGAAVNSLDDKVGGTTPNILEFTARVGAVGKTIGLSAGEVAAFGAVFETVGVAPERAGTAFQNFANQLFTINSATPKAKAAFESMGYSAETFGAQMAANPTQALTGFLTKLNGIQDPVQRSQLLIEIFGKSSSAEIAALATQSGKLSEAFKIAGQDTANLAKMQSEVALKMQDPAVQAKVLQSQFTALGIQLGSVLIPVLSQVLTVLTPLTAALSQFLTNNPGWAQFFVIAAGGLAVLGPLVSIIGTLGTAFGMITGVIGAVVTGFSGLAAVGGTVMTAMGGLGGAITAVGAALLSPPALIAAVVTAMGALILNVGGSRDALIAFSVAILDNLITAFDSAVAAVTAFGSSILSGVQSALTGAIGAVTAFGSQLVSTFQSAFSSAVSAVQSAAASIQSAVSSLVSGTVSQFQSMGSSLVSAVQQAIAQAISAVQSAASSFFSAGASLMKSFADGVASSAGAAYNQVSSAVSNVRNLLPFSPAKEGPLSDLDKSGMAFFKTFASGINADYLQSKLTGALSSLSMATGLNFGALGNDIGTALSSATSYAQGKISEISRVPLPVPSAAGAPHSVTYNQNISIDAKMNAQDIIATLKGAQRDFLRYLSDSELFKQRKQS